jgi:hypothetical protein
MGHKPEKRKSAAKGCHHKRGVAECKQPTERKKPGPKPGFKKGPVKKIVGHEMPPKVRKAIEMKFGSLQKKYDQFGEHVASFVYNTNTDAGVKAMKMIPDLMKDIKAFKSEVRVAREALKPVFAG